MSRLALIADLHFGSVEDEVADLLAASLRHAAPDLVLVAGDLTMRARDREFDAYLDWERALGLPTLVIPGNHDIPARSWSRFTDPFGSYQAALDRPVQPERRLAGAHVVGFNTVAPWQPHLAWKEGRARRASLALAGRRFAAPAAGARIVVAHHPFARVPGVPGAVPVLRAGAALDLFAASGVGIVVSGHTHVSFRQTLRHNGAAMLALGAPTALSNRRRGEENGYWLIDMAPDGPRTRLMRRAGGDFAPVAADGAATNLPGKAPPGGLCA